MPLWQLARLARQTLSGVNVIIPEIFREYSVGEWTGEKMTTSQGIR
jgi:hypothetical protein